MSVDSGFVAQLKAESQSLTLAGPQAARWATQGASAAGLSPFATGAGAAEEGSRRGAIRGAPHVRERAIVAGAQIALFGRCITLVAADLGYAPEGERVFVIGVEEMENGTSVLTVVRRLS